MKEVRAEVFPKKIWVMFLRSKITLEQNEPEISPGI